MVETVPLEVLGSLRVVIYSLGRGLKEVQTDRSGKDLPFQEGLKEELKKTDS
jgi:hypothetical protein